MGFHNAKKPMIPEELVRPGAMIKPLADTLKAKTTAHDTAKATQNPRIAQREGPFLHTGLQQTQKPAGIGLFSGLTSALVSQPVCIYLAHSHQASSNRFSK